MKEFKFKPGQKVWTIYEQKAVNVEIYSIKLEQHIDSTTIDYYLNVGSKEQFKCHIVKEEHLFNSKKELIDSL